MPGIGGDLGLQTINAMIFLRRKNEVLGPMNEHQYEACYLIVSAVMLAVITTRIHTIMHSNYCACSRVDKNTVNHRYERQAARHTKALQFIG